MTKTTVSEVMTTPVMTVEPDDPLPDVAWAMREKEIKSIVVIDEACQPLGILTSTDFVQLAVDERRPDEATVADYMTSDVVAVEADTPVDTAVDRLLSEPFTHIPVLNEGVVGIVSMTDLVEHLSDRDNEAASDGRG